MPSDNSASAFPKISSEYRLNKRGDRMHRCRLSDSNFVAERIASFHFCDLTPIHISDNTNIFSVNSSVPKHLDELFVLDIVKSLGEIDKAQVYVFVHISAPLDENLQAEDRFPCTRNPNCVSEMFISHFAYILFCKNFCKDLRFSSIKLFKEL